MRKLLAGKYMWNVQFPEEFKSHFAPFFEEQRKSFVKQCNPLNAFKLFKSATCYNLQDIIWRNLEIVGLPISYKNEVIEADDL